MKAQNHKQVQAEVKMEKKWRITSEYIGDSVEFNSVEELLEALRELNIHTDALQVTDKVIRSRAYSEDGELIVEALHLTTFNRDTWIRHPSWHVVAEEVKE